MEGIMDMLVRFQRNVCVDDFVILFGKSLGKHLWRKYNTDLLVFWSGLDLQNRRILAKHLEGITIA